MQFLMIMIRSKLEKNIRTVSFSTTPLSGCFYCITVLCTQNKYVRIKTVLNFSTSQSNFTGIHTRKALTSSRLRLYFPNGKRVETTVVFPTAPYESFGILNKTVLFSWKLTSVSTLFFEMKSHESFIFLWSTKRRWRKG